jgi:Protein of unknown function (DUF1579)
MVFIYFSCSDIAEVVPYIPKKKDMKKTMLALSAAVLLFTACNNEKKTDGEKKETVSAGKEEGKDTESAPPSGPMDTTGMTQKWMDFMTPGDMHKWLEKTNGTWEGKVVNWGMDPTAPPDTQKAVNVQSSILGGRYVMGKFSSTMMKMPFEGMSTMGYDKAKKIFSSTWVDNMGTGIVRMSGTYDEGTKTLNLKGTQTDPMTGKDSDMREEMKMLDDNSYTMIMYGAGMDGKEMKFMEGTFKRKK